MKLAGHEVGVDRRSSIAGPCVIESAALTEEIAGRLAEITTRLNIPFVFKASFDKANPLLRRKFRAPGSKADSKCSMPCAAP